jgi:tetratricopeptide (TPR) repeat protein
MSKRSVSRKNIAPKTRGKENRPSLKAPWPLPISPKLLLILLLSVATFSLYWPVRNYEFINLDDSVYVYDNPQVKAGLSLKGVIWAFTTLEAGFWHPLTWLSHMLDCQLYGLNPGWHHLTNLLFHIASTLLIFLVLERMTKALWASSLVAALFALHPLHVESVAWVAERKDVLSTFFWMLTLWTYALYTERPKLSRYLGVLLSFVLGLLSKAMLVTLPCVLLLLDYWPLGRFTPGQRGSPGNSFNNPPMARNGDRNGKGSLTRHVVLEKVPFFALAAIFSFLTFLAEKRAGAVQNLEWYPWEARIGNALVSYLTYIGKMIWPYPLAVRYPHPGVLPVWQVVGAGLFLGCLSILVVRAARKHPYLLVGWLWYLVTLLPVIGLVQVGGHGMADRYTYVPLVGLFIMIAWWVPDILAGWRYRKAALAGSAGLLLSIFMIVTGLQIQKWHDNITLFTHTLKVTHGNAIIENNLGLALAQQGKPQEAIAHYTQALGIKPDFAEAHYNLGIVLSGQGKGQEALSHFAEALRINPNFAEAHYNLGIVLSGQGKSQEALSHFAEALRINPNFAEAHNNLGIILAQEGKGQEALSHFAEALRINPNFAGAHNNLGIVLAQQGNTREAITHFTQALRINPDFTEAHFSLGLAYSMVGNRNSALEEYRILEKINPEMANALAKKIFK